MPLAILLPALGVLLSLVLGGRRAEWIALGLMPFELAIAVAIAYFVWRSGQPLVYSLGGYEPPLGITLSEADYWQKYLGFDDVGAFGAILVDAGRAADRALIAELVEAKRPLYRARAEASLPLFPGATELIRRRATAWPVAIVSGALRDEIVQIVGLPRCQHEHDRRDARHCLHSNGSPYSARALAVWATRRMIKRPASVRA